MKLMNGSLKLKRSEAVKAICDYINNNVNYYYKNGVTFNEHDASDLLSEMLNLGMKKPLHPTLGYEVEELSPTRTIISYRKHYHEWESE